MLRNGGSPSSFPSCLGAARGDVHASSARRPEPRPPPAHGLLTSRHAGAHHRAAGSGRCALGAWGCRVLMSPRLGAHARRGRSWRTDGRAGRRAGGEGAGAGAQLGSASTPWCRPSRHRRLGRQLLPAPRAGEGPRDRSPKPRARSCGRVLAPSQPPARILPSPKPVAATRAGGGGGWGRLGGPRRAGDFQHLGHKIHNVNLVNLTATARQ